MIKCPATESVFRNGSRNHKVVWNSWDRLRKSESASHIHSACKNAIIHLFVAMQIHDYQSLQGATLFGSMPRHAEDENISGIYNNASFFLIEEFSRKIDARL